MPVLLIKLLNGSKNNSFPFFNTFSSSGVSLIKNCAVLSWIMFSSSEPVEFFKTQEAGGSVNPAAFDGDETVLDEACILLPQPPK